MKDKINIDTTKPYTLLKGDTLELLPLFEPNTFDAVFTDPPYASGSTTTKGRMMTTAKKIYKRKKLTIHCLISQVTSKTNYHGRFGLLHG